MLSDDDGQILEAHSISAGLDYPGVGPEHAFLKQTSRATYLVGDRRRRRCPRRTSSREPRASSWRSRRRTRSRGSADVARAERNKRGRPVRVAVCLSGRGDKDLATMESWKAAHS